MTQERRQIAHPRDCIFDASDWRILSRHWSPIALMTRVTDRPVAARLLDVELVIFRSEGRLVVTRDLCPHCGMRLSCGWWITGRLSVRITACISPPMTDAPPSRPGPTRGAAVGPAVIDRAALPRMLRLDLDCVTQRRKAVACGRGTCSTAEN